MRIPNTLTKGSITFEDGFSLDTSGSPWLRTNSDKNSKEKIEAMFTQSTAFFTVRVDKETNFKSLQEYGERWLKSYGQFGLEVLGHQYFKNDNDSHGLVIDLANSTTHKKMRQAIFFKESRAVVLTCSDQASHFDDVLKDCNQLIKTFGWIEEVQPVMPIDQLKKPQS